MQLQPGGGSGEGEEEEEEDDDGAWVGPPTHWGSTMYRLRIVVIDVVIVVNDGSRTNRTLYPTRIWPIIRGIRITTC